MTNKLTILIAVLFLAFATSCEKNKNSMTDNMAADIIAKSIGSEAGGTNQQFAEAGSVKSDKKSVEPKATNTDFTVTYKSNAGDAISLDYTFNYSYNFAYNTNQELELALAYSASGNLATDYLSSEDSSTGSYVISGLNAESLNFTINGSVNRKGTQTSTLEGTKTYTSNLDIVFTDLKTNKLTKRVNSGTATVSFTGEILTGDKFSFTGIIVYNNNNTATLTINNSVYTVNLSTSSVMAN